MTEKPVQTRGQDLRKKMEESEKRGDQYRADHQGLDVRVATPQEGRPSKHQQKKEKGSTGST